MLSHVQLFVTPWTTACQAPLSVEIFQTRIWSGLPCPVLPHCRRMLYCLSHHGSPMMRVKTTREQETIDSTDFAEWFWFICLVAVYLLMSFHSSSKVFQYELQIIWSLYWANIKASKSYFSLYCPSHISSTLLKQ